MSQPRTRILAVALLAALVGCSDDNRNDRDDGQRIETDTPAEASQGASDAGSAPGSDDDDEEQGGSQGDNNNAESPDDNEPPDDSPDDEDNDDPTNEPGNENDPPTTESDAGIFGLLATLVQDARDALDAFVKDPATLPDSLQDAGEHLGEQAPELVTGDEASLQALGEDLQQDFENQDPESAFLNSLRNSGNLLGNMDEPASALLPQPPLPVVPDESEPGLTHYIGALHEHSGYSDGAVGSEPRDYFQAARDAGLHFLGSADHSDNLAIPLTANEDCLSERLHECLGSNNERPSDALRKWPATLEQARAASTTSFTGFRGFEWTTDVFGHINVFFSKNNTNAKTDGGYATLETFWQWFSTRPEHGGGSDGLATFNHPNRKHPVHEGFEDTVNGGEETNDFPGFVWNDFELRPEAVERMVGIEVFGKGSFYDGDGPNGSWYAHALDKGWYLAPVGGEDHHGRQWAQADLPKTVLIARDLSEAALRAAMLNRRMYAVAKEHNDLRIQMDADGEPMGSRLGREAGAKVMIAASVSEAGKPFNGILELVSSGGEVVHATNGAALRFPAVVEQAERWYFLRVNDNDGQPVAFSAPVWLRAGGPYPPRGEWLAGDLHTHTAYSHDAYAPYGSSVGDEEVAAGDYISPDEFFTLGHTVGSRFLAARMTGLDYLAVTDHNNVRAQSDSAYGNYEVIPIPSYENSLDGHAQMHGARRVFDKEGKAIAELADELRAEGGVFQINHPADGSVAFPDDADWDEARDGIQPQGDAIPDSVEVINIHPAWQPPLPSASSNAAAIRYWEGWLDKGFRVAATSGSDNHYLWLTPIQAPIQPTTWVFVTERSTRGVLEGMKAGRTSVSLQPPAVQGSRIYLESDIDGDGVFETPVGGEARGSAAFRIRVEQAPPGAMLRILGTGDGSDDFTGGQVIEEGIAVSGRDFVHDFRLDNRQLTWIRAELYLEDAGELRAQGQPLCDGIGSTYCDNPILLLALTSAIYLQ